LGALDKLIESKTQNIYGKKGIKVIYELYSDLYSKKTSKSKRNYLNLI
jgi:hypothetical protein